MSNLSNPPSQSSALQKDDSLLGLIADEFLERLKRGEQPRIEEYVERYPHLASVLGQILPALQAVRHDPSGAAVLSAVSSGEPPVTGTLGDFRLFREIGRGGMGIVYEAEQISLGRRVALKVLPFAAALDPKQLQRFRNEAQAAAHLHHTNIVPVYAVGCERGVHFYAMQYIEGQTVAAVIRALRQVAGLEEAPPAGSAAPASALAGELLSGRWAPAKRREGAKAPSKGSEQPTGPSPTSASPQPPPQASPPPAYDITPCLGVPSTDHSTRSPAYFRTVAHLAVQAAEALEHAHSKGIIHRDVKPANLLIDVNGNLWITDFGLARMLTEAGLTMTGDLVGTLRYMSPEQALAKRVAVDHRTDLYSLGVTLYELLALRPAYDGRDRQEILQQIAFEEPRLPRRFNKAIPAELETIVRKAIAKQPAERYATAQELADDLRRFLDDQPIRAKRPTVWDWTRKWARRHQGVVATGIGGLFVALTILLVSTVLLLAAYQSEAREKQSALTALYRSLVREAEAMRRSRAEGYRDKAWRLLQEAQHLETPEKDLNQLRREAIACMGDFVGLDPTTWSHFPADVNAIALHLHGALLALGLSDGTVSLRDLRTGRAIADWKRHSSPVTAVAFAADGAQLVSGDRDGTIHIWGAKASGEWRLARTIITPPKLAALVPAPAFPFFMPHLIFPTLRSIAIAPDSKQLAASCFFVAGCHSLPTTIALWSLADGTPSASFESTGSLEWITSPEFSADGKSLVACYLRYAGNGLSLRPHYGVLIWDLDRRGDPTKLSVKQGAVYQARFSPDGKLLACACEEGLALFDTATLQCQIFPRAERTSSIAFSPDSHLLAIANELQEQVRLWKVANHREVAVLAHPGRFKEAVHSVACSRDALVTASHRIVRIWDLAGSGEKLILAGHAGGAGTVAFSPDGNLLATGGKDMAVNIWDAATGQPLKHLSGFGGEVEPVAFSPDGKALVTGDWTGSIQFWNVPTGAKLPSPPDHGLGRRLMSVAFSPDGRYFAASTGGAYNGSLGGVALWRIQGGGTTQEAGARTTFQRVPGPASTGAGFLTFSPDSQLLAWADCDGGVHLWDLKERQELPFSAHAAGPYKSLAFQRGGKHLLLVADTGVAEAWDVTTGQKAFTFADLQSQGGTEGARLDCIIALSSDGSRLAAISGRNVTIWDTASKKLSLTLPEEQGVIYSLAWCPNRERLAVGMGDGGLAIWDLAKVKAQLEGIGLGW